MNSNDILDMIGETPEKYVLDAMDAFNGETSVKHKPTVHKVVQIGRAHV